MKKLFVQFYLLLFVCFLVMTMMVGLVYKFTAERAGRQSLDPAARLEQNAQRAGP